MKNIFVIYLVGLLSVLSENAYSSSASPSQTNLQKAFTEEEIKAAFEAQEILEAFEVLLKKGLRLDSIFKGEALIFHLNRFKDLNFSKKKFFPFFELLSLFSNSEIDPNIKDLEGKSYFFYLYEGLDALVASLDCYKNIFSKILDNPNFKLPQVSPDGTPILLYLLSKDTCSPSALMKTRRLILFASKEIYESNNRYSLRQLFLKAKSEIILKLLKSGKIEEPLLQVDSEGKNAFDY